VSLDDAKGNAEAFLVRSAKILRESATTYEVSVQWVNGTQ